VSSFFRLHPRLRHAIVHDLGWRALRPVQELTIDAVLDGDNAIVLAPTAGGKTEASMFPALSRILSEGIAAVAALYVSPIRALLNNQEQRLQQYARMVGLDAFKWHGDVAASSKERFRREPAHLLMITPESLEVMLIGQRTDAAALFRELSLVVVDEVHAFAADDRGAHLVSVLERLTALCGRDVQRVGLSATVGNPEAIGRWLQGSSGRGLRVIDPPRAAAARELTVDLSHDVDHAAAAIAARARGKKSLVFVESRSHAEKVGRALKGRRVEVFIHHSSVSRADRELAERQFVSGHNTAIVCTSTMELGIDVGDLDHVMQIDAPRSVASFLQRVGRTGRRPGARSNASFHCLTPMSLVQAVALLRLAERGWVEDVEPATEATHILAHQIMALSLERGGVSRHRVKGWLAAAAPFAGLGEERVQELVDAMVEREILHESGGLLSLGAQGERRYGRKNFFELYAVFSAPPMLRVLRGQREVGFVDATFLQGLRQGDGDGPLCFHLSGEAWVVAQIDWSRGLVRVRPAEVGRVPSWLGPPKVKSYALCQAMAEVLRGAEGAERGWLSAPAAAELDALREDHTELWAQGAAPLEEAAGAICWHTFAGGAINRLLAAGLERETGTRWVAGDLTVRAKDASIVAARQGVRRLGEQDWEALAVELARGMARGPISKFQPCLPPKAEDRLLVSRLLDVEGAIRFVARAAPKTDAGPG